MNRDLINRIFFFVFVVILQVLLLNKILFFGYINPYFYIFFILMLPFEVKGWELLTAAFLLGLSIDMFSDSLGMHTAATVFLAFCRPLVIRLISSRPVADEGLKPNLFHMGFSWIITYSAMLIFIHHASLFFLEVFRFTEFFTTMLRVLLSSLVTFILVFIAQLLIGQKK